MSLPPAASTLRGELALPVSVTDLPLLHARTGARIEDFFSGNPRLADGAPVVALVLHGRAREFTEDLVMRLDLLVDRGALIEEVTSISGWGMDRVDAGKQDPLPDRLQAELGRLLFCLTRHPQDGAVDLSDLPGLRPGRDQEEHHFEIVALPGLCLVVTDHAMGPTLITQDTAPQTPLVHAFPLRESRSAHARLALHSALLARRGILERWMTQDAFRPIRLMPCGPALAASA